MQSQLAISVLLLDAAFHGRADGGELEWPPSPFRLFQALVAAAAARWPGSSWHGLPRQALHWLERQPPPRVYAPRTVAGAPFRVAVPNNDMDLVAEAWSKRQEPKKQPNELKTMKHLHSTWLRDGDSLHYVWDVDNSGLDDVARYIDVLSQTSRAVVALGWGVDLVAAQARVLSHDDASRLPGECWRASAGGATMLRTPVAGALDFAIRRHEQFLTRINAAGIALPQHAAGFRSVAYRRSTDPAPRQFAAFQLLTLDADAPRPFAPLRPAVVAGMLRNAVGRAATAAGRDAAWIETYAMGHGAGPRGQSIDQPRFSYLPVPTIDPRGVVGSIRRVLAVEPAGGDGQEARWARRCLAGVELLREGMSDQPGEPAAVLSLIPKPLADGVLRRYVSESATWTSTTPVLLPGFDDRDPVRTEILLRKGIAQAGFNEELVKHAELDWRRVGYRRGVELASRYTVPRHLASFPRYHVRITWRDQHGNQAPLPGPICIGAGRFSGLGLFAAES